MKEDNSDTLRKVNHPVQGSEITHTADVSPPQKRPVHVTKWPVHNRALVQRGSVSLWLSVRWPNLRLRFS